MPWRLIIEAPREVSGFAGLAAKLHLRIAEGAIPPPKCEDAASSAIASGSGEDV